MEAWAGLRCAAQRLPAGARHLVYVRSLRCVHGLQILQELEAGVTQSFWQVEGLSFGSVDAP